MSDDQDAPDGYWDRVSTLVVEHPVRVLFLAALLMVPPLFALPSMRLSNDTLDELPADSPSVLGFEALTRHFPAGQVSPVLLVIDDDEPVTQEASFRALADLSKNLKRLPGVATVRSVAMPTNGEQPDLSGVEGADQAAALPDQLRRAANGAARIDDGLELVREGLARIDRRLPELQQGLAEAESGAGELLDGVLQVRTGVSQLRGGVSRLRDGLAELGGGLREAQEGTRQLRSEVAVPAEDAIRAAWETLFEEFTVGRTDPAYEDALREVGETYGRVTGENPQTGQQVDPAYEGLPEALGELAAGLGEAIAGVGQLDDGLAQLDDGLVQLDDGLGRLADGLRRLEDGLGQAEGGVAQLQDGIGQLLDGVRRLEDGAGQLATGLNDGVRQVENAGLQDLLPGASGGPFVLTAGMLEAVPDLREQLSLFLTSDATRTRMFIGLEGNPFSPEAIDAVDTIAQVTALSLSGSPLDDATVASTGVSPFFDAVDEVSDRDFRIILVAVLVGVFLVLVLLLKAIVAPLYMVATVLLSFGTALGIATLVFQGLLGNALAWWIPPFLYVLLVALGADYNIYLMSRVREEANTRTTRRAIAEGTRATGHVITSAGLILAGTFAALMAAPMTSLAQMGFATTVGILLDTFVVRSFVVPALAALFGRHNWWPSSRAYAD